MAQSDEFKEALAGAATKADTLRAEGLKGLERIAQARQASLERERERLSRKLGAEHPRAKTIATRLEGAAALRRDLGVEVARAQTVAPRTGPDEWTLHGYVFSKDLHPAPDLTISLVDAKGQWVQALGFACSDARGYFRLVATVGEHEQIEQQDAAASAPALEAWIRVTDAKRVELHRDAEPLQVSAWKTEYREIVLAKEGVRGCAPPEEDVGLDETGGAHATRKRSRGAQRLRPSRKREQS